MKRREIQLSALKGKIIDVWNEWFLLTAGDFAERKYNAMTVSWGSMGVIWDKPFVQVVVRPTRHTHGFMEKYDTFTLCAFPQEDRFRKALGMLGSLSGRDGDKIGKSGLTPAASVRVAAPSYEEAILAIECRKMYFDDLEPDHFLAPFIAGNYHNDYHRCYFGEIIALSAVSS